MNKFGKLIQTARYKKKWSQAEVARRLCIDGPQYISNIERGACDVSPEVALRLAKILDISRVEIAKAMGAQYRAWLLKELGL